MGTTQLAAFPECASRRARGHTYTLSLWTWSLLTVRLSALSGLARKCFGKVYLGLCPQPRREPPLKRVVPEV